MRLRNFIKCPKTSTWQSMAESPILVSLLVTMTSHCSSDTPRFNPQPHLSHKLLLLLMHTLRSSAGYLRNPAKLYLHLFLVFNSRVRNALLHLKIICSGQSRWSNPPVPPFPDSLLVQIFCGIHRPPTGKWWKCRDAKHQKLWPEENSTGAAGSQIVDSTLPPGYS